MSDYHEDDSEDNDFLAWFIRHTYEEAKQLHGNFRLVMEDEIIFGLRYTEALDLAKQLIAEAGFTVWDYTDGHDWTREYFVEESEDEDLVLWATVEAEGE